MKRYYYDEQEITDPGIIERIRLAFYCYNRSKDYETFDSLWQIIQHLDLESDYEAWVETMGLKDEEPIDQLLEYITSNFTIMIDATKGGE